MVSRKHLLGQYDVILFDLMDTLMFGGNRFSAGEDYAETYQRLGGRIYPSPVVQSIIHEVYERMHADYSHPDCYTNFPPASVYINRVLADWQVPPTDADRLAFVFAHHELGHIPEGHIRTLHVLGQTHRLGIVSNLWAEASLFRDAFERVGIHALFDVVVFSSDHACIKPSPRLFQVALDALAVEPNRVLFVGDDVERDVAAAQALGMGTVLVDVDDCKTEYEQRVRSVAELIE